MPSNAADTTTSATSRLLIRSPLLSFWVLAYGISWGAFLFALIPGLRNELQSAAEYVTKFGPALAGLLVVLSLGGAVRREWFARLVRWRVHPGWYLVALGGPAVLWLAAISVFVAQGGAWPNVEWSDGILTTALGLFTLRLFAGGGFGEEPGWRGFALPRLESKMNPLDASLLIGVVWGLWHAPAFFVEGQGKEGGAVLLGLFTVYCCALSVIFTWFFHKTNGSILLVALLHASFNSTENVFKLVMPTLKVSDAPTFLFAGLTLVSAVLLAVGCGTNLRSFRVPGKQLSVPCSDQ